MRKLTINLTNILKNTVTFKFHTSQTNFFFNFVNIPDFLSIFVTVIALSTNVHPQLVLLIKFHNLQDWSME